MKLFFDVDGVLIDGWHADEARRKPWDATIEADLGVDREAFRFLFFGVSGARTFSPMHACVIGQADLKAALAEVLPEVGYNGDVDDFVRYWFENDSNLNAEVFEFVRKVRAISGAEMFLATGQEHYRAGYLWNELGFSKYFDAIFYSAKIGFPKTDWRFFDTINHALLISPEERPLFFDDSPGIVALARQAGWDATLFRSASDIRDHPRLEHLWA